MAGTGKLPKYNDLYPFWEIVVSTKAPLKSDYVGVDNVSNGIKPNSFISIIMWTCWGTDLIYASTDERVSIAGIVNDEFVCISEKQTLALPYHSSLGSAIVQCDSPNGIDDIISDIIKSHPGRHRIVERVDIDKIDNTMKDVRNYL